MSTQVFEFKVAMTCEGCSGAINRILNRHKDEGISKVEIDLPSQKVLVHSTLTSDKVMELIKKAGKETTFVGII